MQQKGASIDTHRAGHVQQKVVARLLGLVPYVLWHIDQMGSRTVPVVSVDR